MRLLNDEPYLLLNDRFKLPSELHRAKNVRTYKCAHCHYIVVMSPTRTRDREFCNRCESLICDECNVVRHANGGADCKPFKELIDMVQQRSVIAQEQMVLANRPIVFDKRPKI